MFRKPHLIYTCAFTSCAQLMAFLIPLEFSAVSSVWKRHQQHDQSTHPGRGRGRLDVAKPHWSDLGSLGKSGKGEHLDMK